MKKNKAQTGTKKLSRQYAVMVFAIQMITALIFCLLVRIEAVNIYLSAKNDIISEWLGKETRVMDLDYYNPSPSWNLDYWKAHYTEFSLDIDSYDEDTDPLYAFSYELKEKCEDDQEAAAILNAMSADEQLKYARFQYYDFLILFGRHSDNYGYEGCSCFIPLENGKYMVLVEQDKECNMLNDAIFIEESSKAKDQIMAKLGTEAAKEKGFVDFIRVNRTDENGKVHNIYVGFAPVFCNGEMKAVMTLEFNYDSFVNKINSIITIALAVLISVNLLVCVLFIHRTRKIATRPITAIQGAVRDYMATRSGESARNKLESIRSDNEIGVLADDVDKMIVTMDDYVSKIEEAGIRHKELTKDVMEALASAIDAKDKYTNGHSKRVAEYSRKIAELAGKSAEECEMIYNAGLLHDVGKIGVPLEILQKKGRLTDEEFEQIKRHPVVGGQILSTIHETAWLSTGAKYHHERYNGRGYPEGLKGEEIPEIDRIIAVADAYDAMTSNRSYRDAIPQHIVREEFVKGSGTQFDPEFAKIMIHMIDLDIEYRMKESMSGSDAVNADTLRCESIYHDCSGGINITGKKTRINLCSQPDAGQDKDSSIPTIIVFDALDGQVHPGEEGNKDILYCEYAHIRLDGEVQECNVRKSEVRFSDADTDMERTFLQDTEDGRRFLIEAVRNRDHVQICVSDEKKKFEVILALSDTSRYAFISITGEHCEVHNIKVDVDEKVTDPDDIPRIAEEISFIKGCPEGDVPNIESDGPRLATTQGMPVSGDMTLSFHAMSFPTARLVWHCPYFCIFSSANGQADGANYHEYLLLKMDGENWESEEKVENVVKVEQTDGFTGWKNWMEKNKEGIDCLVKISRENNRVILQTENSGIRIHSMSTIQDCPENLYIAITGDQCAITDIRMSKA